MGKHLLDETAEFSLPRLGRHASSDAGELEVTQWLEPAASRRPARRPGPDEGARPR